MGRTEGTSLFSTCVLAASVVTFLRTAGLSAADLMGMERRTGAAKARGAKRESIFAVLAVEEGVVVL